MNAAQLLFAAQVKLVRLQCDIFAMMAQNQLQALRGEEPTCLPEDFRRKREEAFDGPRGINELMNAAIDVGPNGIVVYGQGRKKEKMP